MIRSMSKAVILVSLFASSTAFASTLTVKHSGKVLDVPNFNPLPGVGIVQWTENGAFAFNQWFDVRDKGNGYYEIASSLTRQCLDAANQTKSNGTPIIQWPCHGGNNQLWRVDRQADGYVRFFNKHAEKCMTVSYNSRENGAIVVLNDCTNDDNQRFRF